MDRLAAWLRRARARALPEAEGSAARGAPPPSAAGAPGRAHACANDYEIAMLAVLYMSGAGFGGRGAKQD